MDVFDLTAKLTLDKSEYESGLDKAKGMVGKVGGAIGSAVSTVAKVSAVAVGAGATAIGALGKQAIDAYADYEQLVGGVETLFGAGGQSIEEYAQSVGKSVSDIEGEYNSMMEAQEKVLANADKAYETAGLSANEYMETVTSFAASLVSSLDGQTDIAADVANQAIIDMSDNANKMGSSMESIQNAYKGFSKQNYTMLDNLKLGYGGTKEEMQRLLDDAEKLPNAFGRKFDMSNFADVVDAIHLVQENMGITGTTAREASETISGSLSMMKSSWQNVVTAIVSGHDIETRINELVNSVKTFGKNIIPAIKSALSGIGDLIKGIAPMITELLPVVFDDVLPPLIDGSLELIKTIGATIMDNLDMILDAGLQLLMTLIDGIVNNIPKLIDGVGQIVTKIKDFLLDGGNLAKIVEGATKIIIELAKGLIKAIPEIIKSLPQIIKAIFDGIVAGTADIRKAGGQLIDGLWNGIKEKWENLKAKVKDLANGLVASVKGVFGIHSPSRVFANIGEMMVAGLENGSDGLFSDKGLHATVSADVKGKYDTEDIKANGFSIDYDQLGASVANALAGFSINMDGRTVAQLLAGDMNYQLGVLNARRV